MAALTAIRIAIDKLPYVQIAGSGQSAPSPSLWAAVRAVILRRLRREG
jgi:hypothetical protein